MLLGVRASAVHHQGHHSPCIVQEHRDKNIPGKSIRLQPVRNITRKTLETERAARRLLN